MKRYAPLTAFLLLAVLLIFGGGSVSAKGEWQEITIRPLDGSWNIRLAPQPGDVLREFIIFDWDAPLPEAPQVSGEGYEIWRGYLEGRNQVFEPFDALIYYPGAVGEASVIQYVGLIDAQGQHDGYSEYDGHWFTLAPDADAALREIVTGQQQTSAFLTTWWAGFHNRLPAPFGLTAR